LKINQSSLTVEQIGHSIEGLYCMGEYKRLGVEPNWFIGCAYWCNDIMAAVVDIEV
jgi:hypothetical protein